MDVDVVKTLEWKPFCNNTYQKGKDARRETPAGLKHRRRPVPIHRNVEYIPDGMGSVNARATRTINKGAEVIGDYGDDYVFEPHCACCWPEHLRMGASCRLCEL